MRGLVLLALAAGSSKPAGPLDVLRAPDRGWTYEVVRGPAIDQLAPVAGTLPAVCRVRVRRDEQLPKTMATSEIRCAPTARGESLEIHFKQTFLVFDAGGVRELPGPGSPATDKSFALGFTFPVKLASGTWTYDRGDRVQSRVEVRAATADVLGKTRPVWISSSTYKFDPEQPPQRGAAMFAPGVAPVLLCDVAAELTCLRLVGTAPPKRRPKFVKRLPAVAEREELARWLQTIETTGDLLGDVLAGQLVLRDDLAGRPTEVRAILELDATEVRYQREKVMVGELLVKLDDARAKLRDTIERGLVAKNVDVEALQRQLYVAIAADTPWQRIADVLDIVAITGFTEPLFVFARTSRTPPPPKHWIDDFIAEEALAGNVADVLGSLINENIAGCDELRAAFTLDLHGETPPAKQLVDQISAALPKIDCWFDLAALRATLWNTLGTRYPYAILPAELGTGEATLALPANTTWREASKNFTPGMALSPAVRE